MAHEDLGTKSAKHKPGCVAAHETTYREGDTCSYRWQAAKRARADQRIGYPDASTTQRWNANASNVAKLEAWKKAGKASAVSVRGGLARFSLAPFTTCWWPWDNHAHHIIPRSVLVGTLEEIAGQGSPHDHRLFDIMIHGLLGEPYNINDEPNVMMLPLLDDDAIAVGLPRHLDGSGSGTRNHPKYSRAVRKKVAEKLCPPYRALVTAVKSRKHQGQAEAPAVRPILEGISNATYDAIISQATVHREAGASDVSLDTIASTLFR